MSNFKLVHSNVNIFIKQPTLKNFIQPFFQQTNISLNNLLYIYIYIIIQIKYIQFIF